MKKILMLVLALALVLTVSAVVFVALAEGAPADEEIVTEETVEEPAEKPAEEPAEEPVEEPAEEPAEEPVEEPAEEAAEDPFEALVDLYQYWVEGEPAAIDFRNAGTKDIVVEYFFEYAVYTPITDFDAYWETFDPDVTPPHDMIGQETVTFVVPAGETVRVSLNAELDAASDIGRNGYLSATYAK